jgi:hypothetical protein
MIEGREKVNRLRQTMSLGYYNSNKDKWEGERKRIKTKEEDIVYE